MKQVIGCGHPCKGCFSRRSKRSERPIFLKTFYMSTMADNSFIHFPDPLISRAQAHGGLLRPILAVKPGLCFCVDSTPSVSI